MSGVHQFIKLTLLLGLSLVVFNNTFAGVEYFNGSLSGSDLAAGKFIVVQDDKYPDMSGYDMIGEAQNRVFLAVDPGVQAYYPAFTVTAELDITARDGYGNLIQVQSPTLMLEYNPATGATSVDKHGYSFYGAHWVKVSISSITCNNGDIPTSVYLRSEISIERYYHFNTTTLPVITSDISSPDEIKLSWDYIPGAEEYDLEWTYVDDYDGLSTYNHLTFLPESQIYYDFEFNSTRVIVKNTNYSIPMIYEHGYLLYRVRGVGYWEAGKRYEGAWSAGPAQAKVSQFPSKVAIDLALSHQQEKFNWMYQVNYSDNGRHSDGISYCDGLMRERQTVKKDNSIDRNIVQCTYYDYSGRPAVVTLPAPAVIGADSDNDHLHFYPGLIKIHQHRTHTALTILIPMQQYLMIALRQMV